MEILLKRKKALLAELKKIDNQIRKYDSGFKYVVFTHCFGNHFKDVYKNSEVALDHCSNYNQDNGYADIYTDDPNFKEPIMSGTVFFIENIEDLNSKEEPKGLKVVV